MNEPRLHAHMQICHENGESLSGFDPRVYKDRKHVHRVLDHYLDILSNKMFDMELKKEKEGREPTTDSDAGFHVWPEIDTH